MDRVPLIGLENAGAWAVTAGLLHVIPYLGPLARIYHSAAWEDRILLRPLELC